MSSMKYNRKEENVYISLACSQSSLSVTENSHMWYVVSVKRALGVAFRDTPYGNDKRSSKFTPDSFVPLKNK